MQGLGLTASGMNVRFGAGNIGEENTNGNLLLRGSIFIKEGKMDRIVAVIFWSQMLFFVLKIMWTASEHLGRIPFYNVCLGWLPWKILVSKIQLFGLYLPKFSLVLKMKKGHKLSTFEHDKRISTQQTFETNVNGSDKSDDRKDIISPGLNSWIWAKWNITEQWLNGN